MTKPRLHVQSGLITRRNVRAGAAGRQQKEKSSASPATAKTPEPYAHSAHWSESLDLPNFSVTIDADVEVPEQNAFHVCRVEGIRFSQRTDALKGILNALNPDADGVRIGGMTREQCSKKIVDIRNKVYSESLLNTIANAILI